jgi:hypothetical protein
MKKKTANMPQRGAGVRPLPTPPRRGSLGGSMAQGGVRPLPTPPRGGMNKAMPGSRMNEFMSQMTNMPKPGGAPTPMPQEQVRPLPTPPRGGMPPMTNMPKPGAAPTPMPIKQVPMMKKGGAVKGYAKGGKATRGDGCCMKGKTKGMMK